MKAKLFPSYPQSHYIRKYLQLISTSTYQDPDSLIEDLQVFYNYQNSLPLGTKSKLLGLKHFINSIEPDQKAFFLEQLIQFIAKLALKTEEIWPDGIDYLGVGDVKKVDLTKSQVSVILANMYLMITPRTEQRKYLSDPCYILSMEDWHSHSHTTYITKLKCMFSYFSRIFKNQNNEQWSNLIVSYQRLHLLNTQLYLDKIQDGIKFGEIKLLVNGSIEDEKEESIKADFANKMIGGGVLLSGNVQEEILFSVCPEKLASILLSDIMKDEEAIIISGAEHFCKYTGYGGNFTFVGDYEDNSPINPTLNRKRLYTACIDAILFSDQNQYESIHVIRELKKCLTGFSGCIDISNQLPLPVVTGNWGCGMFRGDVHLKCLIQWIACSLIGTKMVYCGFQDQNLFGWENFINTLQGQPIKPILELIQTFEPENEYSSLFEFLKSKLQIKKKK